MTITAAKLAVEVGADTSAAKRELAGMGSHVDGMGGRMGRSFGGIGAAGAAAFAGIGLAAGGAIGWGLKVAADNEQATIAYEGLLGSAALAGDRMAELKRFNNETPFDLSSIIKMDQSFLQVGMSAQDSSRLMLSVSDVMSGMGKSSENVDRVNLALSQMILNERLSGEEMRQLTENGVDAWGALEAATGLSGEALRDFVESGTADSQILVDALMNMSGPFAQFEGASAKQAKSLSGMFTTLKDTLGQGLADVMGPLMGPLKQIMDSLKPVFEKIGESLGRLMEKAAPVFGELVDAFMPILDVLLPALVDAFTPAIEALMPVIDALAPVIGVLAEVFAELMRAVGPLVGEVIKALAPILTALAPVFVQLIQAIIPIIEPLLQIVTLMVQQLAPVIEFLAPILAKLIEWGLYPFMQVLEGLGPLLEWLVGALTKGYEAFRQLWDIIGPKLGEALSGLVDWFKQIPEKIGNLTSTLWEKGKELVKGLWDGIVGMAENVWNWFRNLPSTIWNFVKDAGQWAFNAGKNLVMGLWNGIKNMAKWVWDKITGWLGDMWNGILDFFGISSPSKRMAEVGEHLAQGLADGIGGQGASAVAAMNSVAAAVMDAAQFDAVAGPTVSAGAAMPAGSGLLPLGSGAHGTLGAGSLSSGGPVTVVLQVDGRRLGEVTLEHLNRLSGESTVSLAV